MGCQKQYVCECGFSISDDELNYFIDEETNCVVEHASGRLTFDMGRNSEIKGKIIPSFCPDCSCEVHFCYSDDESCVDKIKSALKTNEEDFKDILDEKYMYRRTGSHLMSAIGPEDKTHGQCPKCGKKIPLITGVVPECPKCGRKIYIYSVMLYD